MTEKDLAEIETRCECCNQAETEDVWVRCYKVTGGVTMCKWCSYEWYDNGGTNFEIILRNRFPEEFGGAL